MSRSSSQSTTPRQSTITGISGNGPKTTITENFTDLMSKEIQTNLPKSFIKYDLLVEYKNLSYPPYRDDLSGLYCTPTYEDIYTWFGMYFIHHGVYTGALIRFKMIIPQDYPLTIPKIILERPIYHPLLCESGEFSLAHAFPTWNSEHHGVFHVLSEFKEAFTDECLAKLSEKQCIVKELYHLWNASAKEYQSLIRDSIIKDAESNDFYKKNDENPIRFTKISTDRAEQLKNDILENKMTRFLADDQVEENSLRPSISAAMLTGLGRLLLGD